MREDEKTICVDLDGTLIKTDLSWDAAEKFLKDDLSNIFKLISWYFKGIPYLKYKLSEKIEIDPTALPYNFEFLSYLTQKKSEGSKIYLATGAAEKYARQVADYLQIFDGVFSSDLQTNLIGKAKADKLAQSFPMGFAYAGNSLDDLHVWKRSLKKILVNPSERVLKAMRFTQYSIYKS